MLNLEINDCKIIGDRQGHYCNGTFEFKFRLGNLRNELLHKISHMNLFSSENIQHVRILI